MGRRPKTFDLQLSDDAIGIVTITNPYPNKSLLYFDKACTKELNTEYIMFNKRNLTIHQATIDEKGYKLSINKSGQSHITPAADLEPGYYEMVLENKEYKLYKHGW